MKTISTHEEEEEKAAITGRRVKDVVKCEAP